MEELRIDSLLNLIKAEFDQLKDKRASNQQYSLGEVLQSGLAIFSLKDSSLLDYNSQFSNRSKNILRIYKISNCPSDTQMRSILDEVAPIQIERIKRMVLEKVKQSGLLKEFEYFKGWKLLLVDGVHHYSSKKVKCDNCLKREHEDGTITYSHAMLCGVIAHPSKKEVLPIAEEAIIHQDGETKNDCELNASIRLIKKIATRNLGERFIFVEDALYANGPHVKLIQSQGNRFIIRVKPGSGAGNVIEQYEALMRGEHPHEKLYKEHKLYKLHGIIKPIPKPKLDKLIVTEGKIIKEWHYVNGLYLNESHKDLGVGFVHYEERSESDGRILKKFEWITDIILTEESVKKVVLAGRSRWKIENETFNTLKNQGYHFEHNFGHGHKNLCTNFALLMMLAFLIDQIQQLCNEVFQKALVAAKRKKYLWNDMRSFFRTLPFDSMEMIYKAIIYGVKIEYLAIQNDSS